MLHTRDAAIRRLNFKTVHISSGKVNLVIEFSFFF